jgi:hypothetical protein
VQKANMLLIGMLLVRSFDRNEICAIENSLGRKHPCYTVPSEFRVLYEQGLSKAEIARRLGFSEKKVRRLCAKVRAEQENPSDG